MVFRVVLKSRPSLFFDSIIPAISAVQSMEG